MESIYREMLLLVMKTIQDQRLNTEVIQRQRLIQKTSYQRSARTQRRYIRESLILLFNQVVVLPLSLNQYIRRANTTSPQISFKAIVKTYRYRIIILIQREKGCFIEAYMRSIDNTSSPSTRMPKTMLEEMILRVRNRLLCSYNLQFLFYQQYVDLCLFLIQDEYSDL